MRLSAFAICLAACAMSIPVFAGPPREAASKPAVFQTDQRPASIPVLLASPILAQTRSPGLPMGASSNVYGNSTPSASMLPSNPSYSRPRSSSTIRSYRYPNANRRPDYRPPANRPGYGGPGYGSPGYGSPGYGSPGYGSPGYGSPGYNRPSYGSSNSNRPGYHRPGHGYPSGNYPTQLPYYPQLHHHWNPTCWTRPYRPAYYNYGYSSVSGSWLSIGGTSIAFVNPFYVRPVTNVGVWFDYSRPIRVPSPTYRESRDDLIRSERAINRFDDAREVFRRGEYGRAMELIDEAIALLPNDPTLHQFRALVLFARQRYQDAAAVLYSVLAVSPGWDANTVAKVYGSPQTYLAQVRDLEQYVAVRPDATESEFLLAYHYALNGNLPGAERLLKRVEAARPGDRVVRSLLIAIRG